MPGYGQMPPVQGQQMPGYAQGGSGAWPAGPPQGFPPSAGPTGTGGNRTAVIIIIALALIYYVATHLTGSEPKSVVNRCLDGIQEWNASKVLECVRPAERAMYAGLPTVFEQMKAKGLTVRVDQRTLEVAQKSETACIVQASYTVTLSAPGQAPQSNPVRDAVQLVSDDGHWYINGSQMFTLLLSQGGGYR